MRVWILILFSLYKHLPSAFCKPGHCPGPSNAEGMRCGHFLLRVLSPAEKLTHVNNNYSTAEGK